MRSLPLSMLGPVALLIACGTADAPADDAPVAEDYPDAIAADPAHYAVEFENDVARLLRITYGPGERSIMHRHPATCSIALSASNWRMTAADGAVTDEEPGTFGTVECGTEASVHLPENSGSTASELILLEFKEGATRGMAEASEYPDAVVADPEHYAVEFENDIVRVLRITYGPGEQSVLHHHPANCSVSFTAGTWHMTDGAGAVTENTTTAKGVSCGDATVHSPVNGGAEPNELILIEFKNRATFEG